jgi:nicotinamide-nucleotide amidase
VSRPEATIVARDVLEALVGRGQTLATAESLTGGGIGRLLTSVPGASRAYRGGLITYATDLKATLAGVDPGALAAHGPVAAETAVQMAVGAARRCEADWGLAVTGVAGPEPQDGHPVGQVFVGIAQPAAGPLEVHELALDGDREHIRAATTVAALALLLDLLGRE